MHKFAKPMEDTRLYVFFCKECNVGLCEPTQKSELKSISPANCRNCLKHYSLSIKETSYFVVMNAVQQVKAILNDEDILETVVKKASDAKKKYAFRNKRNKWCSR